MYINKTSTETFHIVFHNDLVYQDYKIDYKIDFETINGDKHSQ